MNTTIFIEKQPKWKRGGGEFGLWEIPCCGGGFERSIEIAGTREPHHFLLFLRSPPYLLINTGLHCTNEYFTLSVLKVQEASVEEEIAASSAASHHVLALLPSSNTRHIL